MSTITEVTVIGMTCGHCVTAVTEEVSALYGVTDVQVTLDDGRVVITSDVEPSRERLAEAISEAGYELA